MAKQSKFHFHFRRYKKKEGGEKNAARHPKLIVEERKDEYGFMGLTKSSKKGHHKNIPLKQNPKSGESYQSYLRNELRYDLKNAFGEVLPEYRLSEKDAELVVKKITEIHERKKKR